MSQVQFPGSCSQDSGPQGHKSQVPGTQFWGPGCQGPISRVLGVSVFCLRVLESRVSSLSVRVPGFRGASPGSQVLILDYASTVSANWREYCMILMKNDSVCGFTFTGNEEFEEHSELLVSVVHLELKLLGFIPLYFTHLFLCFL